MECPQKHVSSFDLLDADDCLEPVDPAGLRRTIKFGLIAAVPFYALVAGIVWILW